ncbi:IS5 family transposase [archaeon SCG-AAA382B04]|nr:IS5 family transposase [archaeon SCG-AAA382B04]
MGLRFEELKDEQWKFVEPVLPSQPETGRPRADDRRTINGILYVLITGCKWSDMPEKYGSYVTAWRRLKRWQKKGVWQEIVERLQEEAYREGELGLDKAVVDSTTVEAKKGDRK